MDRKDFSRVTDRIRTAANQQRPATDLHKDEQHHLRAVEKQIAAIARGDLEAALSHAAPNVELEIFAPPEFKWIAHARGVDQLRAALAHNIGSVVDQSPEILNVVAQGDTVVLMGRETGRIRATGEPTTSSSGEVHLSGGGSSRSASSRRGEWPRACSQHLDSYTPGIASSVSCGVSVRSRPGR
jgi:ketosteroid isomerase-like protein